MNVLYAVWDIADDKWFRKPNTSDASQYEILYPELPAHVAAWFWVTFEILVLICFLFVGLVAFKVRLSAGANSKYNKAENER